MATAALAIAGLETIFRRNLLAEPLEIVKSGGTHVEQGEQRQIITCVHQDRSRQRVRPSSYNREYDANHKKHGHGRPRVRQLRGMNERE